MFKLIKLSAYKVLARKKRSYFQNELRREVLELARLFRLRFRGHFWLRFFRQFRLRQRGFRIGIIWWVYLCQSNKNKIENSMSEFFFSYNNMANLRESEINPCLSFMWLAHLWAALYLVGETWTWVDFSEIKYVLIKILNW